MDRSYDDKKLNGSKDNFFEMKKCVKNFGFSTRCFE